MSIYEHAEEQMPPREAYDPAMDHPEPEPAPRKPMPFSLVRNGDGSKVYKCDNRTILTRHDDLCKYAFVIHKTLSWEPYLSVDRRDVAKLLRHYRKEAQPC